MAAIWCTAPPLTRWIAWWATSPKTAVRAQPVWRSLQTKTVPVKGLSLL